MQHNPCATHLLIRNNEIALKGRNRANFERQFIKNLTRAAGRDTKVVTLSDRIVVPLTDDLKKNPSQTQELIQKLSVTSGVFAVTPCMVFENYDMEILKANAETWTRNDPELTEAKSFAVRTRRVNKNFPLEGIAVDMEIGSHVRKLKPELKTNLKKPDLRISIELRHKHALIYSSQTEGVHGLPQDPQQRVICLLSGGIDSPVAAAEIMRRGCSLVLVHFHSRPYTSEASIQKVKKLASIIRKYSTNPMELWLIPLLEIQTAVRDVCNERHRTIHYRRYMMRIAEELARRTNSKAIVSGEALGQVASQTLTNIGAIEEVTKMPVLRPLISFDKDTIVSRAKKIGTYETSIEPHDDSCVLFAPSKPATQAISANLAEEDALLSTYQLIFSALDGAEKVII